MRKVLAGILIFDMVMGVLCLAAGTKRYDVFQWHEEIETRTVSGEVTGKGGDAANKIALTFDDDVIIGLSQEISYKEAVSMI